MRMHCAAALEPSANEPDCVAPESAVANDDGDDAADDDAAECAARAEHAVGCTAAERAAVHHDSREHDDCCRARNDRTTRHSAVPSVGRDVVR